MEIGGITQMRNLIELRGNKSREEVAEVLGISTAALTAYEENARDPRDEVKHRMFEYYGTRDIIFCSTLKSEEIQKLLKKQYIDWEANDVLKEICGFEKELIFAMHHAYNYGVIQGKREERARRKKAIINI